MDNKEYENRHEKTAKRLRIIGFITLFIALGCIITAAVDFFISINRSIDDHRRGPELFFLFFIGFPLLMAGVVCLSLGYSKKVNSYINSQNAPVAKDYINYMGEETGDTFAHVAGKVSKEINQGKNAGLEGIDVNTCSKCGNVNPVGAKFCSKCGAPIVKKCPHCGTENDDSAKFCNNCGKELHNPK